MRPLKPFLEKKRFFAYQFESCSVKFIFMAYTVGDVGAYLSASKGFILFIVKCYELASSDCFWGS